MLHCTIYLSLQQINSFQQFFATKGKQFNSAKLPQPGRGASLSVQPKEQFVSIGQARTEKTICVNFPGAGWQNFRRSPAGGAGGAGRKRKPLTLPTIRV